MQQNSRKWIRHPFLDPPQNHTVRQECTDNGMLRTEQRGNVQNISCSNHKFSNQGEEEEVTKTIYITKQYIQKLLNASCKNFLSLQ